MRSALLRIAAVIASALVAPLVPACAVDAVDADSVEQAASRGPLGTVATPTNNAGDVYAQIKALEANEPAPKPVVRQVVSVASIVNASSVQGPLWAPESCIDVPGAKPPRVCQPSTFDVTATSPRFFLEWRIPAHAVLRLSDGRAFTSDGSPKVVDVPVNRAGPLDWTVTFSGRTVRAGLRVAFDVPVNAAFGAYTIPVVSERIVYAPPQYAAARDVSRVTYFTGFVDTRALRYTSSSEATGMEVTTPLQAGDVASALAPLAAQIPQVGGVLSQGLSKVGTLLGHLDTREIDTQSRRTENGWSWRSERLLGVELSGPLGPGHGDMIYFHEDVRYAWVFDGATVYTTMLSAGRSRALWADRLRDEIAQRRPVERPSKIRALEALLQEDVLVTQGSWPSSLDATRFETIDVPEDAGGYAILARIASAESTSRQRTTSVGQSVIEDYTPGLLAPLGIGEQRNGESRIGTVWTRSVETSQTTVQQADLKLYLPVTQTVPTRVYFDRLQGTFLLPMKVFPRPDVGGPGPVN